jgi:hypothetical protein
MATVAATASAHVTVLTFTTVTIGAGLHLTGIIGGEIIGVIRGEVGGVIDRLIGRGGRGVLGLG